MPVQPAILQAALRYGIHALAIVASQKLVVITGQLRWPSRGSCDDVPKHAKAWQPSEAGLWPSGRTQLLLRRGTAGAVVGMACLALREHPQAGWGAQGMPCRQAGGWAWHPQGC